MFLPQPDWIANTLVAAGPEEALRGFLDAARGPGFVPWVIDYDRLEEDLLALMLAPAGEGRRAGISLPGARILARNLREAVWESHEDNIATMHAARGCPLDLNRLVPVPWDILRLGEAHPQARQWLWRQWGTTWPLRRVTLLQRPQSARIGFFSADWSPWPVLVGLRARFPALRFDLTPDYAAVPVPVSPRLASSRLGRAARLGE